MKESDKNLVDELKDKESELNQMMIDLRSLKSKVEIAYQYEDDLLQRLQSARNNTKGMQKSLFEKSGDITAKLSEMKKIMDIWTGNFYSKMNY